MSMRIPKILKKDNHSWKKKTLQYVAREIRKVMNIYFNWKHGPFQFYKKTNNHYKNCIKTEFSDQN